MNNEEKFIYVFHNQPEPIFMPGCPMQKDYVTALGLYYTSLPCYTVICKLSYFCLDSLYIKDLGAVIYFLSY